MFSGKEIENIKGLSEKEVSERLRQHGYNEITSQKKRNVFLIFFNVVKEPMLLLLIGSGTIFFSWRTERCANAAFICAGCCRNYLLSRTQNRKNT
jgi:magnesium-transporting ATPase (P-type)